MTPERLAEIEARAAKATAGPWLADEGHIVNSEHLMIVQVIDRAYWRADNAKRRRDGEFDPHTADDQDFIAHAREDVPALVAEVKRLRAAIERVRRESNWCPICDHHHTGECAR